jgi:hypothetical protein
MYFYIEVKSPKNPFSEFLWLAFASQWVLDEDPTMEPLLKVKVQNS